MNVSVESYRRQQPTDHAWTHVCPGMVSKKESFEKIRELILRQEHFRFPRQIDTYLGGPPPVAEGYAGPQALCTDPLKYESALSDNSLVQLTSLANA
jgi:hypothetical protein